MNSVPVTAAAGTGAALAAAAFSSAKRPAPSRRARASATRPALRRQTPSGGKSSTIPSAVRKSSIRRSCAPSGAAMMSSRATAAG